jgi:hypothetical protein
VAAKKTAGGVKADIISAGDTAETLIFYQAPRKAKQWP